MLPDWFDQESWKLLLEAGTPSSYSYFVKFRPTENGYSFFITDLCTIWAEDVSETLIKEKLKPYENFLELSVNDLLGVLSDMLKIEGNPRVSLSPSPSDGSLAVECGTQIGFVKFTWSFNCLPLPFSDSARHFRGLLIPAIQILAGRADSTRNITVSEWNNFEAKRSKPVASSLKANNSTEAIPEAESPVTLDKEVDSAEAISVENNIPVPSQSTPVEAKPKTKEELEMERRQQLAQMLQKPAESEKKKKRKLI